MKTRIKRQKTGNRSLKEAFLALFLLFPITFFAQTSFSVECPDIVSVGDNFKVSFFLKGSHEYENFETPQINGAEVLFGPTYSPRQITGSRNGKQVSLPSLVITYTLQAKQEGKCFVGESRIIVNGKSYKTAPHKISIVKSESLNQQTESSAKGIASNDLFMRASVSKKSVYEQEPVLISLYLYSRIANLSGLDRTPPEMSDFLSQEIPLNNNRQWSTESVNGRLYYKALIWQILAYPQRDGKLTIPAFGFDFMAMLPKQKDSKKAFRGSDMQQVKVPLKSNPIEINVRKLPSNAPQTFEGSVGQMEIAAQLLSSNKYKTHESFRYRLTIKGKGNGSLITTPLLQLSDAFEVYTPEESINETPTTSGTTFVKTIDYTIVPTREGEYTIPSVHFSYFDPQNGEYIEKKTSDFHIKIERGTAKENQDLEVQKKKDMPILSLKASQSSYHYPWYSFLVMHLILLLSTGATLFVIRNNRRRKADTVRYKHEKANSYANKRLQKAERLLHSKDTNGFFQEILTTLYTYCSDKYRLPIGELNRSKISTLFYENGIEEDLQKDFFALLDSIERMHYSSEGASLSAQDIFDRVSHLITQLEQSSHTNTLLHA